MEEIYIEFGEVGAPSIYEITKMIFIVNNSSK
jgi:hypothetical protein